MDGYKHIQFKKHWEMSCRCIYQLGECDALVQSISNIPLKPEYRKRLLQVSLIKGAQATTAIEGNTLSEEEIGKIQEGWKLPKSREYQEIEVRNVIEAFNTLLEEIVLQHREKIIVPEVLKRFHQMIGKGLGEHFDAMPGQFRTDNRRVGSYRAPNYEYVPALVEKLCDWIKKEFHYAQGQDFHTAVIQAIVTHVYLEWIHPFGDGNGRTGRLVEFYILLRAGLPSIVSHVLSNFYNKTRTEYYRQLDLSRTNNDLTSFIEYAIQGFRDGLNENLAIIQKSQFEIFWHNYIFESFANVKYTKKEAFKRKREVMLRMPIGKAFSIEEIIILDPEIARRYAVVKRTTVQRDLKELCDINLLEKKGKKYSPKIELLKAMIPGRK